MTPAEPFAFSFLNKAEFLKPAEFVLKWKVSRKRCPTIPVTVEQPMGWSYVAQAPAELRTFSSSHKHAFKPWASPHALRLSYV